MRKKVLTAGLLTTMLALNVTACGSKTHLKGASAIRLGVFFCAYADMPC